MVKIVGFTYYSISGQLSGGDATGGTFGKATVSIAGFFGAVQQASITCGIAAAVCAVILAAILLITSNNPPGRERVKDQLTAITIGCAGLAVAGTILAVVANIGASF